MALREPEDDRIPFKIHPRAFAALGADLVTNDIVAVIELVKNSYDALATTAEVRFWHDDGGSYLDILDDGHGMDRRTIEEAWCVVATPYRQEHPYADGPSGRRRAAGQKGLGRLSAARLGPELDLLTKAAKEPPWHVTVSWSGLANQAELNYCFARCHLWKDVVPFEQTGTRVRIKLKSAWDDDQISDLRENLARLLSPFAAISDFRIRLAVPEGAQDGREIEIEPPEFLKWPPYAIRGHVTEEGDIRAKYEYTSLARDKRRQAQTELKWREIYKTSEIQRKLPREAPGCGPFSFEIRAWDIGAEDTQEVADRFDIPKADVRKAIHAHKGVSLYRDGILVLPKSDDARDWLGLDLRRVSRLSRLSTSQIVGYVSISARDNNQIEDTSDREGLVQNPNVIAFQEVLQKVVWLLEIERDQDREKRGADVHLHALLDGVSAEPLVEDIESLAEEGATAADALVRVADFNLKLKTTREAIKTRFAYYSRLATIGTIAQMLVHEIRNRTTALGRFLRSARARCSMADDSEFSSRLEAAADSVEALERLADTFAPLASRSFKRARRHSVLEDSIARCLSLLDGDVRRLAVMVTSPRVGATEVAVDPAELDTILLNIVLNALYWIPQSDRAPRLEVRVARYKDPRRVRVLVHDSGPGVADKDADRIFLPGVTRKPGGIGMGLTVAAELVSEYGGTIALVRPGKLGGATFEFDVPLRT